MFAEIVKTLIEKYGSSCNIVFPDNREDICTKAMINPMRYENKIFLSSDYIPQGKLNEYDYFFIGDASVDFYSFPKGTVLYSNGKEFVCLRQEKYYIDGKAIYTWAALKQR